MYIKLSLVDELFIIKNFNIMGVEIDLPDGFSVKLFNKIGSQYFEILELTETGTVQRTLITDPTTVYASTYIDGELYKSFIKVNAVRSEVVQDYAITYTSQYGLRPTSTTFLKRYTLSMPAWSSAFKNDVSKYSKLIQPLFLIPERLYYKTNEYLWNNLRSKETTTKRVQLSSKILSLKNKVTNEYVYQTLIKQKEAINKVDIQPLNCKNPRLFYKISSRDVDAFPLNLGKNFNNVILHSDVENVATVIGLNQYGELITESVYINDVSGVTTLVKYKTILSVASVTEDSEILVSNYADCLDTNTIRYPFEISGTVTKTKAIDTPSYLYNSETECLNSYHKENVIISGDLEDSFKIPSMLGCSKFFITNQEDVIFLNNGRLYTGLLRKTVETEMPLYPSNNNNSLVSVLNEDAHFDNIVEFQIATKDLIDNYGNVSVLIRINSNSGTLYLNDNNDWVSEPSYKLLNNINPIFIEMNVASLEYVSVEVVFNSVIYQASVRKDVISTTEQDILLDDLLHDGDDLIGVKDSKYYKINLIKDYYEVIGDNKITYENYNPKDYIITNTRGK